jgi:FixJ family two-component response regulator
MSQANEAEMQKKIREVLQQLSKDEQQLLSQVIKAEKDRIHMKLPRGIYDELHAAVARVIK